MVLVPLVGRGNSETDSEATLIALVVMEYPVQTYCPEARNPGRK